MRSSPTPKPGKKPGSLLLLLLQLGAGVAGGAEHGIPRQDPASPAGPEKKFTPEQRAWWAFQPVVEPPVPEVRDTAWPVNAVDHFILAGLEGAGLEPAPRASRAALIRRLSFDLTGLPPSREETGAFEADPSPEAWEKLVDRLLASPRHGERQARLWLDLVRYADSDGYRADHFRPDAWRYRDYVIGAFNTDKPFDQFVREQLAGDELFPGDPQALTATGYLRHWIYEWNNRDVVQQRAVILNDITDTTADVFMGLGLQCARCHDHKSDPLLQKDYYGLQAFFAALDFPEEKPAASPGEIKSWQEAQAVWLEATADVRRRLDELKAETEALGLDKAMALFPPETQAIARKPAEERTPLERQIASLTWRQVREEAGNVGPKIKGEAKERLVALQKELSASDHLKPAPLPNTMAVADIGPEAAPVLIPRREREGETAPGFPAVLGSPPPAIHRQPASTGRRSALAEWLTRPDHPLTARVMVNRVWQQHFGHGLITTASDFGLAAGQPSHPALLDWLAHRFVADGWSLKKLHRIILTSAAWRQSHTPSGSTAARAASLDPQNRLLWRWTTRRLEAEQIRDAIFYASGELDLEPGGPGVDSGKPRRAIYTKVLRNTRDPLMDVFDAPQHFQSTASRDTTTTPTQSLFLANSRFMGERAAAMARGLADLPSAGQQVEAAFWRTAGRRPEPGERAEMLAFLTAGAAPAAAVVDAGTVPPSIGGAPGGTGTRAAEVPGGIPATPLSPQGVPPAWVAMEAGFIAEAMPQRSGQAGVFSPGSAMERLEAGIVPLPAGEFSVEAIALLHSVSGSGEAATLTGQWDGHPGHPGWAFGITGRGARGRAPMPVLLLTGRRTDGHQAHEPVYSDLPLQLDRSYYLGFSFQPAAPGKSGIITFYAKDLANDDEPLLTASVPHPVADLGPSPRPLHIGASGAATTALWDGLVDEVRLSRGVLTGESLALHQTGLSPQTLACWQFEPGRPLAETLSGRDTLHILPGRRSLPPAVFAGRPEEAARDQAPGAPGRLTDLCHVLLSSSALFYVE